MLLTDPGAAHYTGAITTPAAARAAMRAIAVGMTTDHALAEEAAAEAAFIFASTGNADEAIKAGRDLIHERRRPYPVAEAADRLLARPTTWVCLYAVLGALVLARVAGWLP